MFTSRANMIFQSQARQIPTRASSDIDAYRLLGDRRDTADIYDIHSKYTNTTKKILRLATNNSEKTPATPGVLMSLN